MFKCYANSYNSLCVIKVVPNKFALKINKCALNVENDMKIRKK